MKDRTKPGITKVLIILFLGVFFIVVVFVFFQNRIENSKLVGVSLERENNSNENYTYQNDSELLDVENEIILHKEEVNESIQDKNNSQKKIPKQVLIDVSFTSQAPFGKWDERHEEACEETSLLMVWYFLQNKKLTKEIAEKEIQALIEYQIKTKGKYEDSTAEELVELGREFYDMENFRVVYDFKKEDLKKYLAKGKPIIVPAAGRLLGNPNFTAPGPLYHNLVLIGYNGDVIITNDPGTRKGEHYQYNIDVLYDAIHDFAGNKNEIEKGRKAMLVLDEK